MKRLIKHTIMVITGCLILSGCSQAGPANGQERRAEYNPDDSYHVYEQPPASKKEETDRLAGMEKQLENEYLELYLGDHYEIGIRVKESGMVYLSNPVFADQGEELAGLLPEAKKLLFSQVSVEYLSSSQKKGSMSSWPDSISGDKNQVTAVLEQDSLTLTYGIGTNNEDTGLCWAFTGETYEYYDKMLNTMLENKEISIIDYRSFGNNYTKIVYEELGSSDKEEYKRRYPNLPELGTIYILKASLTNKNTNKLLEIYTLMKIDARVIAKEEEKMGQMEGMNTQPYFEIPLRLRLNGPDLLVSVDTSAIKVSEGYYLTRVELLKSFGGSRADEEGFVFIPDGSGAIIENNHKAASMDKVTIPFYGPDFGMRYLNLSDIPIDSSFPVFGIKKDDRAVFGIVENGEAMGGVTAQTVNSYLDYNMVYPYFNYTVYDGFDREGVSYAFAKALPDMEYAVRYHFLEGENTSYSAMARYYRSYLTNRGILKKQENREGLPLDITLIGSIEKTVNHFGLPFEEEWGMTSFDEAGEIMDMLHQRGIKNASVVYSGIINGGLEFKAPKKVEFQKELGGLSGFRKLNERLYQMDCGLYTEVDFTRIYEKGNGITSREDVSKSLNRNTAVMAGYNPATGERQRYRSSYLVNPMLYPEIGRDFTGAYEKAGAKGLYLSSIGAYLNGNYSVKAGITRQTALSYARELMELLDQEGYELKFDKGNQYVLPYAHSLIHVPCSSSGQRISSYSVPFAGMVLKGSVPFTGPCINQSDNPNMAVLEAVESGAGLNYMLMYQNQLTLSDTGYTDLFSVNYELWLDGITETFQRLSQDLGYLSNVPVWEHMRVDQDVARVLYEDGSVIYINYGSEAYETPEGMVESMSWLVLRGGYGE